MIFALVSSIFCNRLMHDYNDTDKLFEILIHFYCHVLLISVNEFCLSVFLSFVMPLSVIVKNADCIRQI